MTETDKAKKGFEEVAEVVNTRKREQEFRYRKEHKRGGRWTHIVKPVCRGDISAEDTLLLWALLV